MFCTSAFYYSRLNHNVPYIGVAKQVYNSAYLISKRALYVPDYSMCNNRGEYFYKRAGSHGFHG